MFHAQEIGYGNLRDVLKTFLIVLMIKTLKIECELYLPLENKVINTRNFLEQFHSLNSEDNELYDFDEVKIITSDTSEPNISWENQVSSSYARQRIRRYYHKKLLGSS